MAIDKETRDRANQLSAKLVDQGLLIEAGWVALQMTALAPDAPEIQRREMRMAYFAGAQHLFGSIMGILDPGQEPTERDMKRMSLINDELNKFIEEFKKWGHA